MLPMYKRHEKRGNSRAFQSDSPDLFVLFAIPSFIRKPSQLFGNPLEKVGLDSIN